MIIRYLYLISFLLLAFNSYANYYFSFFNNPKYGKDFQNFDYVNPNAQKKGEIRIGIVGSFDNLNSFILQGSSGDGIYNSYDSLMQKSLDEIGTSYPLIAKNISIDHQRNKITFELNPLARFHNNSLLTSKDVKFTFDILKKQGHPSYKIALQDLISIDIISEYKIQFIVKDVSNKDLIFSITSIPILSKVFFEKKDFNKVTLEPILGSGPYIINNAKSGKYISYKRNNNYWGKDLPSNKGLYNFDKITYLYYRDANIAIQAIKAKEYDIRYENIAKNWATQYGKTFEDQGLIKEYITHKIPAGMQSFVINTRKDKFKDLKVRKALNLAFDFEWTNKNLFFNSYKRTTSFFENSIYQNSGQLSKKHLNLFDDFNPSNKIISQIHDIIIPQNSGNGFNRKYLLEAKKLLASAGYRLVNHQLINLETNKPLKIEFLITSPSFQRVILPFIKNLNKLGIEANIKLVDFSIYQKRIENFDFDLTVSVFQSSIVPGNELYAYWHSNNAKINGSKNIVGASNKLIDQLVQKIPNISDLETLKSYSFILDKLLLSQNYVIPHWNIDAFRLVYWNKLKHPKITPDYGLCLECWYIE